MQLHAHAMRLAQSRDCARGPACCTVLCGQPMKHIETQAVHTWPDALIDIGVTNRDFNANQEIWNFFNRFDLNGPILSNNNEVAISSDILLSPNPANSAISLSNLPIDIKQIIIVNALGKIITSQTNSLENTATINIDDLENGLHFLIVEGERTREIVKFIKI